MNTETINFIRSVLPRGRTLFYSFPDRYALLLLEHAMNREEYSISRLKSSRFAPLLEKKIVKEILSRQGSGKLKPETLKEWWPSRPEVYRLTLGTWPELDEKPGKSWSQVTRWGWNLVLQLNFDSSHKRRLEELVPDWEDLVAYSDHPIAEGDELTLAWSRIDLDLDTGEALIEEVQSDWVRDVKSIAVEENGDHNEAWNQYFEDVLLPETRRWAETMLTATLWFLLNEIGIRSIFYHTFESGSKLKHIREWQPPRSLYTDLPKKFCFETTHNGPLFIRDSAKRDLRQTFIDPETRWHLLEFN
jgi:hypothetical protein